MDRQYLLQLVRQWGDTNTDGLLDFNCQFFSIPEIKGVIGYRLECQNAIVFGEPLCAPEESPALAKAFQEHCQKNSIGVVYTIVSKEFAHWGVEHLNGISMEFGEKFILNPLQNPTNDTGSNAVLVRKKIKHAAKDGVSVHEYIDKDPAVEKQIEAVAAEWLQKRSGPQIYMSHIHIFDDAYGKRWFYARHNNRFVGLLILNQLQSKQGWLLNHLMLTKDAPHGTSELLVISAMQTLEKENCKYVLVGPVAGERLGEIVGLNRLTSLIPRGIYQCAKSIFKLSTHKTFWEKFNPTIQGSYILFPKRNLKISSLRALFKAFNA